MKLERSLVLARRSGGDVRRLGRGSRGKGTLGGASPGAARSGGASIAAAVSLATGLALAACGGAPPKAPNPTRPIDERRALPLIAQALQDGGDTPNEGREITLPSGHKLHVDVSAKGRQYGIAYLTGADLAKLDMKQDLPPRNGSDLAIVQGSGPDSGAVILVLFDTDYQFDDLVGEQHEETTITAEKKLTRDVRDFVSAAHARKLP